MPKVTVELDVPDLRAEVTTDPSRTALLVVDLQNHSCHPQGYRFGGQEATDALSASEALVDRARAAGVPVLWLQSVRKPDAPIFTVYGVEPYRLEGTWDTQIAAPLSVNDGEPIFKKYSHDCFHETELEAYLAAEGITAPAWTFLVVGTSFSGCVYHAVTGLSVRDYRVLVPMNCVAPRTGNRAAMTLARLGHRSYSYNVELLVGSGAIRFGGG